MNRSASITPMPDLFTPLRLGPLVLQSHLSLKLDQPEPTSRGKPAVPPSPGALLSLNLAFYGPRSDAALSH